MFKHGELEAAVTSAAISICTHIGATENAGVEYAIRSKMQG